MESFCADTVPTWPARETRYSERKALSDQDKQWIGEQFERVETKLLTAFHQWASPMEKRFRGHSSTIQALDEELDEVRSRVKKLEERLGA